MATWLLAFFRYSTAPRALLQTDSSTLYRTTHFAVKFKSSESADLLMRGFLVHIVVGSERSFLHTRLLPGVMLVAYVAAAARRQIIQAAEGL